MKSLENNILSKKSFGSIKGISTKDALLYTTNCLHKSKPVLIGLAKACDTGNHEILIDKMYCYGIRGNELKLNRLEKVKIENEFNNYKNLKLGGRKVLLYVHYFLFYL